MYRLADNVANGLPIVYPGTFRAMTKTPARERTPFGARMLKAREARGLSQLEVKEKLDVAQSTLSELERTATGSSRTVEFAQLYGVDPNWLATGAASDMPAPWPFEELTPDQWDATNPETRKWLEMTVLASLRGLRLVDTKQQEADPPTPAERNAQSNRRSGANDRRSARRLPKS